MDKRYCIKVSDEAVEITGTLTIREAFDFLNFFEREGYATLEDWGTNSTIYLVKSNLEQEVTNRLNKEAEEEILFVRSLCEKEKQTTTELCKKINDLEVMVKTFFTDESEIVKKLRDENQKNQRMIHFLKLKCSPEVAEMMKKEGFEWEDLT